jgi:hypothetical protein
MSIRGRVIDMNEQAKQVMKRCCEMNREEVNSEKCRAWRKDWGAVSYEHYQQG